MVIHPNCGPANRSNDSVEILLLTIIFVVVMMNKYSGGKVGWAKVLRLPGHITGLIPAIIKIIPEFIRQLIG